MDNLIKEQIKFKINDIDKLFSEYDLIFKKIETQAPDLFDMNILGSVLHSFYNGLENIFEIIAKNIDGNVPGVDMQKIKDCYNRGITFWRNANEIQDYSLSNDIV